MVVLLGLNSPSHLIFANANKQEVLQNLKNAAKQELLLQGQGQQGKGGVQGDR
jgi:hypothetical protein